MLNIEPRGDENVFDVERNAENNLYWESHHRQEQECHYTVTQTTKFPDYWGATLPNVIRYTETVPS